MFEPKATAPHLDSTNLVTLDGAPTTFGVPQQQTSPKRANWSVRCPGADIGLLA